MFGFIKRCFFTGLAFLLTLTLFRKGIFEAAYEYGGGGGGGKTKSSILCQRYPIMIKLATVIPYLKKIQKAYGSRKRPPDFCCHQHFFTRNQQIF